MSLPKPKAFNAFVYGVEYIEAHGDEITIELVGQRKAPKGSNQTTGKLRVRLRLTLGSTQVLRFAQAGRRGLEKLRSDALGTADHLRRTIEKLGTET